MGNDFIPHAPSVSIKNSGIDLMFDLYTRFYDEYKENLVNKNTKKINHDFFKTIFRDLGLMEDSLLSDFNKKRNRKKKPNKIYDSEYDRQRDLLNLFPQFNRETEEFINQGELDWRDRYYSKLFDINNLDDSENRYEIDKICHCYLEGIFWNFHYYNYGCISYEWCYPYAYPPTFNDLYNYMDRFVSDINLLDIPKAKPVKPFEQLLMVLPQQSNHLLPRSYGRLMLDENSDIIEYYPSRYEIETTPGGALYLDPAKFKEEDPDGHYFGMSLYADAYYRILAKYGGDQLAATVEFVNQFGVDPTALLTSKSKEVRKRSYTEEGGRFTNSNKDLLKRYPNIGYYMFPDNPLDEFDFNSWTESFAERDRIDLSEEEYVSAVRNGQGRLAYEYQRRLLFDTPMYANIPSSQKFEMLTAVRNALRQEYPGYGTGSTVPTALNVEAKIAELESMLANDYNTKVKLPDGKSVPLNELPAISGVIKYLEQRNRLLSEARLVLGSNVSLQKEELFNARAQLRQLAQELFSTNPDFYYIYLDLFKYEVEEKYNETTFYGGNR